MTTTTTTTTMTTMTTTTTTMTTTTTTTTTMTLGASGDCHGNNDAVVATLGPNQSVAAGIQNAHASDDLQPRFNLCAKPICLSETNGREHCIYGPRRP